MDAHTAIKKFLAVLGIVSVFTFFGSPNSVLASSIAFDNSGSGSPQTTTSASWAYTVNSNTNGILWVTVCQCSDTADTVTAVSYNGVAMTSAGASLSSAGIGGRIYLFYL